MKKSVKAFQCSKGSLPIIRDFVHDWLNVSEVTGKTANQIVLAVDEACANCIIHHHKCDAKNTIEVCMYKQGNSVLIEIKDTGNAFRIDEYKPHAINDNIRNRKKGGLGIFLINQIMDEIEIQEETSCFIYKFTKHISPNEGQQPLPSGNM